MKHTNDRMIVLAALVASATLACATGGGEQLEMGPHAEVTADGLHRVLHAGFSRAYVKPGADLERYNAIIIAPVTVSYKRPPMSMPSLTGKISVPSVDMQGAIERSLQKQLDIELAKSTEFRVVQTPGSDVLRVNVHVIDLLVQVSGSGNVMIADGNSIAETGTLTLILTASDSTSGEALARVSSERTPGGAASEGYIAGDVQEGAAQEFVFHEWAIQMRYKLDKLRELPPVASSAAAK